MSPEPAPDGLVPLLGVLSYVELTGFAHLASDSEHAPTAEARIELVRLAARETRHLEALETRLGELGVDLPTAMAPFVAPLDDFHRRTRPRTWAERLVKAYVGDGLGADLRDQVAVRLGEEDRALVHRVLMSEGRAELVEVQLREALAADPAAVGRLSLYGRRVMGEALAAAHHAVVTFPELVAMAADGQDLEALSGTLTALSEAYRLRMQRLGLTT